MGCHFLLQGIFQIQGLNLDQSFLSTLFYLSFVSTALADRFFTTSKKPQTNGIIQYLSSCQCFISLSIISSRFIHVLLCIRIFFLFKAEYYYMYICTFLSSHSSFSEFLLLWAIVDNVAMNVGVIISVQVPAFNYLGEYTQKWNC